jgi:hypothetical protein
MRRYWDLIRLLLLELEGEEEVDLSSYTEEQQQYHRYLILDANLAEGVDVTAGPTPSALLSWLNWEGHDFLEASRSEPVWKNVMGKLARVGGPFTLEIVRALLSAAARDHFGLP